MGVEGPPQITDTPLRKLQECRGGFPGPKARPFWVTNGVYRVSAGWHLPGSPLTSRMWGAFYSWKEAAAGWGSVAAECQRHHRVGYSPDSSLTGRWKKTGCTPQAAGLKTGSGNSWQTGQIAPGTSLHLIINTWTHFVLTTPEARIIVVTVSRMKTEMQVQAEGLPQVNQRTRAVSRCARLQIWPLLGQGALPPAPTRVVPPALHPASKLPLFLPHSLARAGYPQPSLALSTPCLGRLSSCSQSSWL